MKLNNKGWGMKDMIIYTCILLFILLFVSLSINSFYKNMNNDDADKPKSYLDTIDVADDVEDDEIKINESYYSDLEKKFRVEAKVYASDKEIDLTVTPVVIDVQTLIDHGYIEDFYDQFGTNQCEGYANVYGLNEVDVFIRCSNYVTEGY